MKKLYLILPVVFAAFYAQFAVAAKQDLDQLLTGIKADIDATRLSSPAGNNALEKIDAYRAQAPYDFRIVPLVYDWGKAYVALANNAIAAQNYNKAAGYLDKVWAVASLTPGLEETQERLDRLYKSQKAAASKKEVERRKQLAEAAAKERARAEAARKKRQAEEKKQAELAKKKAAEDKARRQAEERQRRANAAKATAQAAKKKSNARPTVTPAQEIESSKEVIALWDKAEEDSEPIATFPVDSEQIRQRDRSIAADLQPICQAIVDKDASVVVHTENKSDYRWLTVRLTLCLRQTDSSFRLRHSYQEGLVDGQPTINLHPAREVSLLRQAVDEND